MKLKVNSENVLSLLHEDSEVAFLVQPHYPDGSSWTKEQATAWGEAYIASILDETAPLAGDNAEIPIKPRPILVTEEDVPLTEEEVIADA